MVEWDKTLAIGVEVVDEEHKELFAQVNLFGRAVADRRENQVLAHMFKFLATYAASHFAHEEAVMRRAGYPELQAHAARHMEFCDKLVEFEIDTAIGDPTLAKNILAFLEEWMLSHVSREDRRIGDFLRAGG